MQLRIITLFLRRESIFDFLAAWQSSDLATFSDLSGNAEGKKFGLTERSFGEDGVRAPDISKIRFKTNIAIAGISPFFNTKYIFTPGPFPIAILV